MLFADGGYYYKLCSFFPNAFKSFSAESFECHRFKCKIKDIICSLNILSKKAIQHLLWVQKENEEHLLWGQKENEEDVKNQLKAWHLTFLSAPLELSFDMFRGT